VTIDGETGEATFHANSTAATFGDVTTDADVVLAFDAVTAQGSITYMEDEDRFDFDNDVDVIGDLTCGTVASDGAVSGTAITGTSFVIGGNTLDTVEWANLDGQNQTVATTSSPTFDDITMGDVLQMTATACAGIGAAGTAGRIRFMTDGVEHLCCDDGANWLGCAGKTTCCP
ncbi:MAG: hypothetical protein ABH877_04180, partial [bacterium]